MHVSLTLLHSARVDPQPSQVETQASTEPTADTGEVDSEVEGQVMDREAGNGGAMQEPKRALPPRKTPKQQPNHSWCFLCCASILRCFVSCCTSCLFCCITPAEKNVDYEAEERKQRKQKEREKKEDELRAQGLDPVRKSDQTVYLPLTSNALAVLNIVVLLCCFTLIIHHSSLFIPHHSSLPIYHSSSYTHQSSSFISHSLSPASALMRKETTIKRRPVAVKNEAE